MGAAVETLAVVLLAWVDAVQQANNPCVGHVGLSGRRGRLVGPGGPKLVLDRRASAPRTPNCPTASQATPGGTPARLAPGQSEQGAPHPSRTTPGPPVVVAVLRRRLRGGTPSATIGSLEHPDC